MPEHPCPLDEDERPDDYDDCDPYPSDDEMACPCPYCVCANNVRDGHMCDDCASGAHQG